MGWCFFLAAILGAAIGTAIGFWGGAKVKSYEIARLKELLSEDEAAFRGDEVYDPRRPDKFDIL